MARINTPYHCYHERMMSGFSQMSDNDPKVLEKGKKATLKKNTKEWKEELASHSEAIVKADQQNDKSIEDLKEETIQTFKRKEIEEDENSDSIDDEKKGLLSKK
ncbi:hypothetical protein BJ944DRAFT_231539 [Cunninghamella echinulata]|nr:hypothetical protein BJ944DRAFT_231539 [Cunninghamella echinulata]